MTLSAIKLRHADSKLIGEFFGIKLYATESIPPNAVYFINPKTDECLGAFFIAETATQENEK